MAAIKLLNLVALAAIAIVALSSGTVPANALVADRAQVARQAHAHDAIAKRKRDSSGASSQCRPRPSSSSAPPPTSTPPPYTTSTPPPYTPTTTPATSTTTSSVPSPTTSSTNGKHWCLAWGADSTYLPNFASLPGVGYVYSWDANPPVISGLQSMRMLWGAGDGQAFQSAVNADESITILMGMNEPNEPNESNMSPQDAYSLWMQYINPYKQKGFTLISPACTNDQSGVVWYQQFFSLCQASSGCYVDIIAVHAYTTNATGVIEYVTNLHTTYGLHIWITEFADQNFSGTGGQADMDQVWDYAGEMKAFIDNNDWVVGCPFGLLDMSDLQNTGVNTFNSLLNSDGTASPLADFYFNQ